MKEAKYFKPLSDKKVLCYLCPHHCKIADGKHGICLTRQNRNGFLYSLNYCRPVSIAVDPIEKKPLYHFYPGSQIFSTGPNGCTLKCSFCQNYEISQHTLPTRELRLDEFTEAIINSNTRGVAYTYSEPYIWFETIMDVGAKVKEKGLVNVMVTNGYMEPDPLNELLIVVDAMNIDIKSMDPAFYKKLCKGELDPVLRTCETVKKHCHLEITNLLITDENDSDDDVNKLVEYIATNLGKDTPLHLSRYFPRYKLNKQSTPEPSLFNAWQIAKGKLDYVYLGNIMSDEKSDTHCPSCHALLVKRSGYFTEVTENLSKNSSGKSVCHKCGAEINIII